MSSYVEVFDSYERASNPGAQMTDTGLMFSGLYPVADVRARGATGNGVTDDTAAIQSALNAAEAVVLSGAQGAIVYVPPGLYRITNLKIAYGVKLCGAGAANTTLMSIASNGTSELGLVTLKNPATDKDCEIWNLGINGFKSAQSQALHGIHLDQSTGSAGDKRHRLVNVWIQSIKGSGIHVGSFADNVEVHHCRLQDHDQHGIHGEGNAHDWRIYDSEIQLSGLHGIWLQGASTWLLDGNKVGNSGQIDATNYGDDFHIDTQNNYLFACQSGHTLRDGLSITADRNHAEIVVNEPARDFVRVAANDCEVTLKMNYTGGTAATGSAFNIVSGSRNKLTCRNLISSALSATVVAGAAAGNEVTVGPSEGTQVVAYATPYTPSVYQGRFKRIGALTGGITVNATTAQHDGARMELSFLQDGTGGRTITFNAQYLTNWTPAVAANKTDTISFVFRGSDSKWVQVGTATGV